MISHGHSYNSAHEKVVEEEEWVGPTWTEAELKAYVERNGACVVLIDGYAVDVTGYTKAHVGSLPLFYQRFLTGDLQPGGVKLLHDYAVPVKAGGEYNNWKDAGWAFNGGVNRHSQMARRRMKRLRVARVGVQ